MILLKKTIPFICFLITCIFAFRVDAEGSDVNFTIQLVYPSNQIENDAGYFYIPNDKEQQLEVKVKNISAKDIVVNTETASCYSSPTGDLVYIKENKDTGIGYIDDSYGIEKNIVPSAAQIGLKPNEEKSVFFRVASPTAAEGEAIGAVRFFEFPAGSNNSGDTLQIKIKRSITIPVRIRLSNPNTAPDSPAVDIGDISFDSQKGQMILHVSNMLPLINRNANICYEVYDESDQKLFENNSNLIKMAPKTFVLLPIKWESGNALKGSYTVKIGYLKNNSETVYVTRNFSINQDQTIRHTENTTVPQQRGIFIKTQYLLYAGISVLVILILIILFAILRKRKKGE